ncbi:MAG: DM13 domain-containing protein [Nitrososphaerales archaeon]
MRKGVIAGIIAAAFVAAISGYFLISPLFIVKEVNEPIPTDEMAMQDYQEFISMGEEDRMHMASLMSDNEKEMVMMGAAQVTRSIDEEMAGMSEEEMKPNIEVHRIGSFVGVGGHAAEGIAKILSVNGNEFLRFEEFMVINGPDLRVYLTIDGDVKNGEHLGKLKGSKGDQNYLLDAIDASKYDTVVVFCEPFQVVFATAMLQ